MAKLFFQPQPAWAGDFIPFYQDGVYHLFYLRDMRDPHGYGEGVPWYQVTTPGFVHFEDQGEALARGSREAQDLYVFTGSVLAAQPAQAQDGRYHIFYTGHNPHLRAQGLPEQAVMHATSDDLLSWRKIPQHTFTAPADRYEPHDWRDPFVFWNEEAGEYWMLLAARLKHGPSRRRGCTALCLSTDLVHWEVREPFYAPGLYFTHECPDLFRMGDWWYLVFSEFSEHSVTRYRMSRSIHGPWITPPVDRFDSRVHYAAKTASDGSQRFLFGWNATREGDKDDGSWQWGGCLVVHQLVQHPDGTLGACLPGSIKAGFSRAVPLDPRPGVGEWLREGESLHLAAPGGFAAFSAGELPTLTQAVLLEAELTFTPGTGAAGLLLRGSPDYESGYYLRLEPQRQRLVIDLWPRSGDRPFQVESERPLSLVPGERVKLEVVLEGSVLEVYVNGETALSWRLYQQPGSLWGGFVQEGEATFDDLRTWSLE